MAYSDTISIDTDALKNGLQVFDSKKAIFQKTAYSTYKSSYLKTSGSSTVAKLRSRVDGLYESLNASYSGISSYTSAYLNSMLSLEASLKSGRLSSADEVNVISRISRLNAILNGGDPSELEIDPRTGRVKAGIFGIPGSYKSMNFKEFEKANAAKTVTYVDHNGKEVSFKGLSSTERNMIMTAAMSNSVAYYNMVANSNKSLSKRYAALYASEYANSPVAVGYMNNMWLKYLLPFHNMSGARLTKEQEKTINFYKNSDAYKAGSTAAALTKMFVTIVPVPKVLPETRIVKIFSKFENKVPSNKVTRVSGKFLKNKVQRLNNTTSGNVLDAGAPTYDSLSGDYDYNGGLSKSTVVSALFFNKREAALYKGIKLLYYETSAVSR